jgi:hypothetical protein
MFKVARLVLVAALLAIALTGCRQDYDAASGWLASQPGVESVEDLGRPGLLGLSYVGDVRAHIDPALSDADFDRLVADASEYRRTHTDTEVNLQLARGDMVIVVQPDAIASAAVVSESRMYQRDPRVTGSVVDAAWVQLIADRADVVDVDLAYRSSDVLDSRLFVADAFDDPTVYLVRSSNRECDVAAQLAFVDPWLEQVNGTPDGAQIDVEICGEITERVTPEDFIDEVAALHGRFVASGIAASDLGLSVEVERSGAPGTDWNAEVAIADASPLALVEVLDQPSMADVGFRLGVDSRDRRYLALTDRDGTVCDLLDLVRGAPGYASLDRLYLRSDTIDAEGSPASVEQAIDAAGRSPGGCGISQSFSDEDPE